MQGMTECFVEIIYQTADSKQQALRTNKRLWRDTGFLSTNEQLLELWFQKETVWIIRTF